MITITETAARHVEIVRPGTGTGVMLNHGEQAEVLEALARIHGFSLVDRVERKSLLELAEEADEDDNDYDLASTAWGVWQNRCEALSNAVSAALPRHAED